MATTRMTRALRERIVRYACKAIDCEAERIAEEDAHRDLCQQLLGMLVIPAQDAAVLARYGCLEPIVRVDFRTNGGGKRGREGVAFELLGRDYAAVSRYRYLGRWQQPQVGEIPDHWAFVVPSSKLRYGRITFDEVPEGATHPVDEVQYVVLWELFRVWYAAMQAHDAARNKAIEAVDVICRKSNTLEKAAERWPPMLAVVKPETPEPTPAEAEATLKGVSLVGPVHEG